MQIFRAVVFYACQAAYSITAQTCLQAFGQSFDTVLLFGRAIAEQAVLPASPAGA